MKEERVPFKDKSLNQRLKNNITKKERAFFLHPNVPLEVIKELFESKNSALRLGLVIIYRSILENKMTLKLSRDVLEEFKISNSQKFKGLKELKKIGLVSYNPVVGKSSEITLHILVQVLDTLKKIYINVMYL